MPIYVYRCEECESRFDGTGDFESSVFFETFHGMHASGDELVEATKCPRCSSNNCTKAYDRMPNRSFVRGYGFYDKVGLQRDMHKQKLITADPYAQHRIEGEKDHIYSELVNAGQHNPNKQHFLASNPKPNTGDKTA